GSPLRLSRLQENASARLADSLDSPVLRRTRSEPHQSPPMLLAPRRRVLLPTLRHSRCDDQSAAEFGRRRLRTKTCACVRVRDQIVLRRAKPQKAAARLPDRISKYLDLSYTRQTPSWGLTSLEDKTPNSLVALAYPADRLLDMKKLLLPKEPDVNFQRIPRRTHFTAI